jgi:equilibrative nucleoside transporter 1/2/3
LQYFVDYKLSERYTGVNSEYDTFFLSYLGFAAQIPNVVFNWMNIFVNLGYVIVSLYNAMNQLLIEMYIVDVFCSGNATPRIVWSIIIEVVVFIVTVALAMTDSSQWPGSFFWITMGSVVVLNSKQIYIIQ